MYIETHHKADTICLIFTSSGFKPIQAMKQIVSPLFQVGICAVGYLSATSSMTLAQVTSDGTVNTQVNQNGNVAEITGGETRGSNLFHSFQDFSVPTSNEAFFKNANSISNIFSRVTGGNISNIDGAIRANGSASLFLINPAGIIFGENARLDIGGSFYGSTASSILFEDGEFGTVDNLQQPVLTVNAPIGLGFRDNPQDIYTSRSNLAVSTNENISLAGGNIRLVGGSLTAKNGKIHLGGLSTSGIININSSGLIFSDNIPQANIYLSSNALIDVRDKGEGEITINASNLELIEGSSLRSGVEQNSISLDASAGNTTINITETAIINNSFIDNDVREGASGNAGHIVLSSGNLSLVNNSRIGSIVLENGNGGDVNITALELVELEENSIIRSQIRDLATGNAGEIKINASKLTLNNNSALLADSLGPDCLTQVGKSIENR